MLLAGRASRFFPHRSFRISSFRCFSYRSSVALLSRRSFSIRSNNQSDPLPKPVYKWQDEIEDLEGYQPGGFHPTLLNTRFKDGRYEVLHKLGYGSFSTVWLARDHSKARNVALKILAAGFPTEGTIQALLCEGKSDHPGRANVSLLLDEFYVEGPNGHHQCLISQITGCSIAGSKDAGILWRFPLETARSIAAQVILSLDYIHSCGIVHGDIHLNNVLLYFSNLQGCSIEEIYDLLGEPRKVAVERVDKKPIGPEAPEYCVYPSQMCIPCDELRNPTIKIADFGEAFLEAEGDRTDVACPIHLRPPESFFSNKIGFPADIWMAGCAIYDILGERPLFEGVLPDEDDIIAEHVSTLGLLPQRWWSQWKHRDDFFNGDGTWRSKSHRVRTLAFRPLEERMTFMGRSSGAPDGFSNKETIALATLFRGMFRYEPNERFSSRAVMESEWMKLWGWQAKRVSGRGQCL